MLTGLRLGNFKAFGETQHIPIKPLTLIFGANSAGKSSIIHGLLLARHADETGNFNMSGTRISGDAVDLGGFSQYVHRRITSNQLELGMEICLSNQNDENNWVLRHYGEKYHLSDYGDAFSYLNKIFSQTRNLEFVARIGYSNVSDVDVLYPSISICEIHTDGTLLLRFERDAKGNINRSHVNYKHSLFEWCWENLREIEDQSDSYQSRDAYNQIFQKFNEQSAEQTLEILSQVGRYRVTFLPETYTHLPDYENYEIGQMIARLKESTERALTAQRLARKLVSVDEMDAALVGVPGNDGNEVLIQEDTSSSDLETARYSQCYHMLNERGYGTQRLIEDVVACLTKYLASIFRWHLSQLNYIAPMRAVPPRSLVSLDSGQPSWYAGGYEWDYVRRHSNVRNAVNSWLGQSKLKTPYELQLRRYTATDRDTDVIEELVLHDKRFDTYVSHKDVGFGISQVLPVLVAAYASNNQTIAIEQPELHLHPALQAELGDVFIDSALGERKNTFLLETHSEHLILRIMRRMRDTVRGTLPEGMPPVRPEDVAVLYVDRKDDDSTSVVTELALNEEGQLLDPWPGGFFEEGYNERFA